MSFKRNIAMLTNFFLEQIKKNFPHHPTEEQTLALEKLSEFLLAVRSDSLFLLKGYAGTGKSSLMGALVKTMEQLQQKTVLLAPTGRAAKVFASYSGKTAYTIHKKIYRQKVFSNEPTGFMLADNLNKHTLFIVDEASMISNDGFDSFSFGSGRLLDDLIRFVYAGEGCRLLLLGDSAQLPPVGQTDSPALNSDILAGYGLEVSSFVLTQVVRQAEMSGILKNATLLRTHITQGQVEFFPALITQDCRDVTIIGGEDLIETIDRAYDRDGISETIVISRSNKRANGFNNAIRNRILYRDEVLTSGDMLIVAKNNYFFGKDNPAMEFIANGDLIEIKRIRKTKELYGFHFCDATVFFPDYEYEMDAKLLIDTLSTDTPALPKDMSDRLFYAVLEDYADITNKRDKMKMMKEDPFFNAVQIKYAYSVTCHKAQGGQWKNVFIDLSYIPDAYLGLDFYRWLYTAFTRATERVYLINPPEGGKTV